MTGTTQSAGAGMSLCDPADADRQVKLAFGFVKPLLLENHMNRSLFVCITVCSVFMATAPGLPAIVNSAGSGQQAASLGKEDSPAGLEDAIGLCLPGYVTWYIDYNLDGRFDHATQWGLPGDLWAAGEPLKKHRNGCEEIIAYRPHDVQFATWYVKLNDGCPGYSGRFQKRDFWGTFYDPRWERWQICGDFNGNGKEEGADYVQLDTFGQIAIDRNGNLKWDSDRDTGYNIYYALEAGDHMMAGYLGAGCCDEVVIWREATGNWEFFSNDVESRPTTNRWKVTQFGLSEDIPFLAKIDGDSLDDLCVFRPSFGWVFINYSSNGYDDYEVDRIIDYSGEIARIDQEIGQPGLQWTTGALGIHTH